jgi:hypothetical protein
MLWPNAKGESRTRIMKENVCFMLHHLLVVNLLGTPIWNTCEDMTLPVSEKYYRNSGSLLSFPKDRREVERRQPTGPVLSVAIKANDSVQLAKTVQRRVR